MQWQYWVEFVYCTSLMLDPVCALSVRSDMVNLFLTCLLLTARMMADLERDLKLDRQPPQQPLQQQEPSPSAVMAGSGTSFTFSRASSIGSVNAISCSSASSTHNTGQYIFSDYSYQIAYRKIWHTIRVVSPKTLVVRGWRDVCVLCVCVNNSFLPRN